MKKIVLLFLVIALSGCSILVNPTPDSLADDFLRQLKARDFGKMYDGGSEFLHINVTREKFVERAERIVEEMEKADPSLNWRDEELFGDRSKIEKYEKNTYFYAYKKLGEDRKPVNVFISWEKAPFGEPILNDFSAMSNLDGEHAIHLITAGELNYK